MKMLEDKIKHYEHMYSQVKIKFKKLEKAFNEKDKENERILNELKTTKIHLALIEETNLSKEFFAMQAEKIIQEKLGQVLPEMAVNMHSTNVSCFNIGKTSTVNNHEIKINPMNFLQKAANDMRKQNPAS